MNNSTSSLPAIGGTLRCDYPASNRLDVPIEYVRRKVAVEGVRDFTGGLAAKEFIERPWVRRGRYLVSGVEIGTGRSTELWLEARKGGQLPQWRLGMYDPDDPDGIVDWIGRIFSPTADEMLRMRKVALKWLRLVENRGYIGLDLAAYPGSFESGVWRA